MLSLQVPQQLLQSKVIYTVPRCCHDNDDEGHDDDDDDDDNKCTTLWPWRLVRLLD